VAPASAPASDRLAARRLLLAEARAAIRADARRRDPSETLLRVDCEPFPRSLEGRAAHEDLSRREGRYSCLAVTAEFERSEATVGGALGHLYRMQADFESGRYAFCRIAGQAGPSRRQLATTPRACGGR
jgi:hypothetical protein